MSFHGEMEKEEEAPLEEEQIIIPVLSAAEEEEEVKLENDNNYGNQEIGNDVTGENEIGEEVKLQNRNDGGNENYESEENQRQMTTSQDDYELISSKQSSHASINDHEKTPTPPSEIVLQISPPRSPPPSPISGIPVTSSSTTTIVVEGFEEPPTFLEIQKEKESDDSQKIIQQQKNHLSFFQSILNGLSVIAEWFRWAFMDNKWGDIFTHKQQV